MKLSIEKEIEFVSVEALKPYRYNEIFFSDIRKEDYQALKNDIAENGIKTPLHITRNCTVLCGNQRLKIAKELAMDQVPIQYVTIDEQDDLKVKEYVIVDNLFRRQLDTRQRALLVAEVSYLYETGRGGDHGNQYTKSSEDESAKDANLASLPKNDETITQVQKNDSEKDNVLIKTSQKTGDSPRTIARYRKYAELVKENPELRNKPVNTVLKEHKKEQKREKIKEEAQQIQIDFENLYLGDSVEVLKTLPDHSVHCVVTDPPQGFDVHNSRDGQQHYEDGMDYITEVLDTVCKELKRVCKPNAHLYFFVCRKIDDLNTFYSIISKYFEVQEYPLVWKTNNHTKSCDFSQGYPLNYELILFAKAEKGNERPLNFKLTRAVLEFDKVNNPDHVHEKPVKLLQKFIRNSTIEGEVVLDPFAGSGSTAEAAEDCGRKWIVIEKEAAYVDMIKVRMNNVVNGSGSTGKTGIKT